MFYKTRLFRSIAAIVLLSFTAEMFTPVMALALTSGPTQPEFVGSPGGGSLVDPFTGAFSYSIPVLSVPGPNGVGYGLTLNYNNNTSPESEASWVGLGWSLNAGAINRVKRGYPDDYKKTEVKYWRHIRSNKTITISVRGGLEVTSKDLLNDNLPVQYGPPAPGEEVPDLSNPEIRAKLESAFTISHNNYTGYDYFFDLGMSSMGLSVNANMSTNGVKLDGDFRPLATLAEQVAPHIGRTNKNISWKEAAIMDLKNLATAMPGLKHWTGGNEFHSPSRVPPHSGYFMTLSGSVEGDVLPNTGGEAGLTGSWSVIKSTLEDKEDVYGYLYSDKATDGYEGMDYFMEDEEAYNDKDGRLPLPFANADYFAVSGAGVGGSFRAHHRSSGFFRPSIVESRVGFGHAAIELHIGGGVGIGGSGGGGRSKSTIRGWRNNGISFVNNPEDGEPVFFKFIGDRGGVILDADDAAVQLNPDQDITSWMNGETVWPLVNQGQRVGRATYVGHNTNGSILSRPAFDCFYGENGPARYRSFSRRESIIGGFVRRDDQSIKEGIGEFSVVRGDGMTYVYGLPVYEREEMNMSYGLQGLSSQDIHHNSLAYKYVAPHEFENDENLSGMTSTHPYATTYLLTEVISPDYVDRTNNGPTPDDLGGYVIFNYGKRAGSWNKSSSDSLSHWYKWRTPYRGVSYNRGSFSDRYDDAGSFSYGFKEIYYLESIETKTHEAIFHTSLRDDSYEADHDEEEASSDPLSTTAGTNGNPKQHKLDKIELWSKDGEGEPEKLLSTTYFDYNYSLCRNVPNAEADSGKLTLKRVWFEYEGVVSARISPYEFGYEYRPKSTYPSSIQTRYSNILDHGSDWNDEDWKDDENEIQNPDYSPFNMDSWGNYQSDGEQRLEAYKPWVNQNAGIETFDPAAWQLKWIKLPSGGEIHVQYEQNDYRYVQHREAMVMVPLKGRKSSSPGTADWHTYELDLDEVGITNDGEKAELLKHLKKQFGDNDGLFAGIREYMYFRFMFGFIDQTPSVEGPEPNPENCDVEYISGYCAVTGVEIEEAGSSDKLWVKLGDANDEETIPDKICKEFYHGARDGIINADCNRDPDAVLDEEGVSQEDAAASAAYSALQTGGTILSLASNALCVDINYSHSYLRIPTVKDKKGGGIRVKRVLTFDPGLENEDGALYGSEYIYKTPDGLSSGVATNEPVATREENALVYLGIPVKPNADTVVSGKSMRQIEEPVGEALLPGASIGYSNVIVRNIHVGKSGPGFTVYRFYTARDYPSDLKHSKLPYVQTQEYGTEVTPLLTKRSKPGLLSELLLYGKNELSVNATQGYRFIVTHMHGQAEGIAQYVGVLDPNAPDLDGATLVSQITYNYYQPWENIPVMNGPSITDITYSYPGKTVEVIGEGRELIDDMSDVTVSPDYTAFLGFLFPMPFGSISGRYQVDKTTLRAHVMNKVIDYPAILKSVSSTQNGITDRTDYAGFDPASGAPVLIKKYDGYDGLTLNGASEPHKGVYYSVGIPAWQHYTNFDQIAKYQNLILRSDEWGQDADGNLGVTFDKRFIRTTNGDEHYLIAKTIAPGFIKKLRESIVTGDLIEIRIPEKATGGGYATNDDGTFKTKALGVYHVGTIGANRIELLPVSYSFANTQQEVRNVWIEIIKTGRNNGVGASVGGFTTYGLEPSGTIQGIQ